MQMREKYMSQLGQLKELLKEMGQMVERAIEMAIQALISKDISKAKKAIAFDEEIDDKEKEIQNLCLKILLCQQPVAKDLRFVSAALKMITDLERIGDQAADISELAVELSSQENIKNLDHLRQMAEETSYMVIKSIDAYVEYDEQAARDVIGHDDVVDDLFRVIKNELITLINEDMRNGEQAADLLMVAKYFERIGDHATNVAEWVIFSVTGNTYSYEDREH